MTLLAVLFFVLLVLFGVRRIPALRQFGESMEKLTERLTKAQEGMYWDQYDADPNSDVTRRWKREPAPYVPVWTPRRVWRFRLGRVLTPSQY